MKQLEKYINWINNKLIECWQQQQDLLQMEDSYIQSQYKITAKEGEDIEGGRRKGEREIDRERDR